MRNSLQQRARQVSLQLESGLAERGWQTLTLLAGLQATEGAAHTRSYRVLTPAMVEHLSSLGLAAGPEAVDRRVRSILAALIARQETPAVPAGLHAPTLVEWERIIGEAEQPDALPKHELGSDLTLKDLGLCSGRLLAGGAQLLEPGQRLARSAVLRAGLGQSVRFLQLLISLGGHGGLLEFHTSDRALQEFTPDGWDRCYLRAAEVLRAHPQARGVTGSSWFYDPSVEALSPRLAYLRQVPGAGGAQFFRLGPDAGAEHDALATSPTRRAAAAAGTYQPERWLMVWPRQALLSWVAARGAAVAA